jgi:glycosyltransferase involved in cell wall biosynthesis
MKRVWFILLPALVPTGPVKGAIALANALAQERQITLVSLRDGPGADSPLDSRVQLKSLGSIQGFPAKIRAYRQLLTAAGGRKGAVSLSMCLSADAVNSRCHRYAITGASVRSNLPQNYRFDYGLPGLAAAWIHMRLLRSMDVTFAMTKAMASQVQRMAGVSPSVVGNFVDEAALEVHRAHAPASATRRIVFVGSLSPRKQPALALRALQELLGRGIDVHLEFLGHGPMLAALQRVAADRRLQDRVTFFGFVKQPFARIASADLFLLPSHSEGISRASLEALHLGVPCVLRDADGNRELIMAGTNGEVFGADASLAAAVERALGNSRRPGALRASLLPEDFRQAFAARRYLEILESVSDE